MLLGVFLFTLLHVVVPHFHHTHSDQDSHSASIDHNHLENHSHSHSHDSDSDSDSDSEQERENGFLSIFTEHHFHEFDQQDSFSLVFNKVIKKGKKVDSNLPAFVPALQEWQIAQPLCFIDYYNAKDNYDILVKCIPQRGPPSLV